MVFHPNQLTSIAFLSINFVPVGDDLTGTVNHMSYEKRDPPEASKVTNTQGVVHDRW